MKFSGKIGFITTEMTKPGVYTEVATERHYYGDILRKSIRQQAAEQLNDNTRTHNQISIISDAYAYDHFHEIKYVIWKGVPWKVTSVDEQFPRLTLDLGDIYTAKMKKGGSSNG